MSDFRSFYDVFMNNTNLHRIVAIYSGEIVEFMHFKRQVYALTAFLSKFTTHDRILMNLSNLYLVNVATLAALFAHKNIVFLGNSISQNLLIDFIEPNEIIITDNSNFSSFYNVTAIGISACINVGTYQEMDIDVFKPFNTEELYFELFCNSAIEGQGIYRRSFKTIENELNCFIRDFPVLSNNSIFATTTSNDNSFSVLYCAYLSLLSDATVYATSLHDYKYVKPISSANWIILTNYDYLSNIEGGLALPKAKLVIAPDYNLSQELIYKTVHVLGHNLVRLVGSLITGCIGYNQIQQRPYYKKIQGVEIDYTSDFGLVVTKNSINNAVLETDYLSIPYKEGFFIIGNNKRVIDTMNSNIYLNELESHLKSLREIDDVVMVMQNDGVDEFAALITVPSKRFIRKHKNNSLNKLFHIVRKCLKTIMPKEYLPRRMMLVKSISYNESGKVDFRFMTDYLADWKKHEIFWNSLMDEDD